MSRCGLVVRVRDIGRDDRIDLFTRKFYGTGEAKEKHEYYDQCVKFARSYTPEITASEKTVTTYINNINEIVEQYYATTLRRDLRMADYIRRIPQAIARATFQPVNDDIVHEAEYIIYDSIESWGKKP